MVSVRNFVSVMVVGFLNGMTFKGSKADSCATWSKPTSDIEGEGEAVTDESGPPEVDCVDTSIANDEIWVDWEEFECGTFLTKVEFVYPVVRSTPM
ncbi:hypothetical protein WICPIJ_001508 [Wickerhamomyces pijperi]|uniref:Secreted protein n=1 Tax=Wickerhamomyces pijperi TaxID=599730 RepID=A0A9P8TQQ4_WICPI|nr:hypothetical protein WICPIJ_001508 [Wickerhamomyces pijperi]